VSKASQIRQKAQELLQKGHVDKAVQEYRRLITIESKNPNLYNELGDIYLRASDKDQAVQSYEKAAVIYEKVALYNNAVAVCKKILRVNPERTETMAKLAELRAKQKLEGEAASFFAQFVEAVLAGPPSMLSRAHKDVDRIVELMPECEAILAKATELYVQTGMRLRTAEIYSKLAGMAEAAGDANRTAHYRRKLEELKPELSAEETARVAEIEGSRGAAGAPAAAADEGIEAVAGEEAGSGVIEAAPDAAEETGAETAEPPAAEAAAGTPAGETADVEPGAGTEEAAGDESETSAATGGEDADEAHVRDAVEEAEMLAAMSRGREPYDRGLERRKTPVESERRGAREAAAEAAPPPAPPLGESTESRELVEEITSDVEKDDLRSHYDLGMAYLEMGLFTEAIRDFQIASRCADLQLSSMEMIGHCFLKSGEARLAVKQLLRALDIARATGADSLGIHYNLGLAYEMIGEQARAREHFEEVYIVDMAFRDVAEKMKKLAAVS